MKEEDRRQGHTCGAQHDAVIDALKEGNQNLAALREWRQNVTESQHRMEAKIDAMAEIQLAYVAETAQLRQIVTNGLSHNVLAIRERLDEVCQVYGARLDRLESFGWFRDKVTFLRDYLFWIVLGGGFFGGLIYMLLNHPPVVVKKIIGG